MNTNNQNNKKLYVALKDLWILGEFIRKNQQVELLENAAQSFVALGNLAEVTGNKSVIKANKNK